MPFSPFAFIGGTNLPIPSEGAVGWFEASNYESGSGTWPDISGQFNDLVFTGSYSLDASTMGGASILLDPGAGESLSVSDWANTTDITYIEIIRPDSEGSGKGSWGLDIGPAESLEPMGYQFDGTNRIYTWVNTATGFYLNAQTYLTGSNNFVARRLSSGFNGNTLQVSYGNSDAVSLTHYGSGSFTLGRGGATTYPSSSDCSMKIGRPGDLGEAVYGMTGNYAVGIYYNRILSDAEIEAVYNYYSSSYSLV